MTTQSQAESVAEALAKKHLGLETLDARNSDNLDFHSHAVWNIKAALEEAFKLGSQARDQE